MYKKNLSRILLIWAILIATTALFGKTTIASDNAVAVADFLNIGVGARSAALGGAYTSIADDPSAAYWNPGGLSFVNGPQLIFSHFSTFFLKAFFMPFNCIFTHALLLFSITPCNLLNSCCR